MSVTAYLDFYRGRRVMITGGLGFIGSNLAHRLVALEADVLLVDSLIPDYGGNLFNIDGIADRVYVNIADVRQSSTMNYLVRDRDVIFNLAGQVSHIDSMRDPYTDLEINCRSQLSILEACRRNNPGVKVVFAGTRQVYGKPEFLPVTEQHLVRLLPELPLMWVEFKVGQMGVFVVERHDLVTHNARIAALAAQREGAPAPAVPAQQAAGLF